MLRICGTLSTAYMYSDEISDLLRCSWTFRDFYILIFVNNSFSCPGRTIGCVCVWVCVGENNLWTKTTFKLDLWHDDSFWVIDHGHKRKQELSCRTERHHAPKSPQTAIFSWRKIDRKSWEYPNALWYTHIFGVEVCNRRIACKNYRRVSVNAWCNFVTYWWDHTEVYS